MQKEAVTVINIKNFPLELYRSVKMQAKRERRTLKGLIIVALEEYLERHGGQVFTQSSLFLKGE